MRAITSALIASSLLAGAGATADAAVIFAQDFSSSNTVSTYVHATTPSSGQFNAIGTSGAGTTVAITGGALTFTRSSSAGAFSRTTNFSPTPTSIVYSFDLNVTGNAAQTTAAVFQVGSGFTTNIVAEPTAATYARLAVNLPASGNTFQLRNISTSADTASFSGTQRVTWVLNNSGALITYTAPGGGAETVANDTADVFVGTTSVFDDVAVLSATMAMTDLKFAFTLGKGTIAIDNIEITSPIPAPEPAGVAWLVLVGVACLRRRRRWRRD